MWLINMHIDYDGPLYDNRAALAAAGYAREIDQVLAEVGAQKVKQALGPHLQHPTGHYMSQLRADPLGDAWQVHDSGVVYGPWLAGVGSRNRPRPGFPGYPHWPTAIGRIRAEANSIAEFVLDRYLPRMGG